MNSRYMLVIMALAIGTVANAQVNRTKKNPVKTAKGSTKKRSISEAEAKRLHEAQLMKEGKTGIRRAYKRSEIAGLDNMETSFIKDDRQSAPQPTASAAIIKPAGLPPKSVERLKTEAKPPRFIETMVLERKEG